MAILTNQQITTAQGYRLEQNDADWYVFYHHTGRRLVTLTQEELENLHLAAGQLIGCVAEICPCRQAGFEKGLLAPRGPFRPR